MTLIPIWTGTVRIPPLPRRRVQIGGNVVVQSPFSGATTTGHRMISEIVGHDFLKTGLAAPFDEMLVRRPGARRCATDMAVVTAITEGPIGMGRREPLTGHRGRASRDHVGIGLCAGHVLLRGLLTAKTTQMRSDRLQSKPLSGYGRLPELMSGHRFKSPASLPAALHETEAVAPPEKMAASGASSWFGE